MPPPPCVEVSGRAPHATETLPPRASGLIVETSARSVHPPMLRPTPTRADPTARSHRSKQTHWHALRKPLRPPFKQTPTQEGPAEMTSVGLKPEHRRRSNYFVCEGHRYLQEQASQIGHCRPRATLWRAHRSVKTYDIRKDTHTHKNGRRARPRETSDAGHEGVLEGASHHPSGRAKDIPHWARVSCPKRDARQISLARGTETSLAGRHSRRRSGRLRWDTRLPRPMEEINGTRASAEFEAPNAVLSPFAHVGLPGYTTP